MNEMFTKFNVVLLLIILGTGLAACQSPPSQAQPAIELEEHELAAPPDAETGAFQPVQGTQEEILARHASQRAKVYEKKVTDLQGNPALAPVGEESNLVAVLATSGLNPPEQSVIVSLGDTPIFTAEAGLPSPVLPLQGLWTYDGHWALEILFANESTWAGQVFIDSKLINEIEGYDEVFSFQLLADKPFYFYQREGRLGYSFDDQETDLDYDQVPHYRCCGESALNPVQAQDMVAFFAQRVEDWFYVELGDFGSG
jgi:hypothetical protein